MKGVVGSRLSLSFRCMENELPVYYRSMFMSLIKKALEETPYYDFFYSRRMPKPFTFSVYLPIEKIEENTIFLKSNSLKFFVSSVRPEILVEVVNFLIRNEGKVCWRNLCLEFERITAVMPPPAIRNNYMYVRTMSPIHMSGKDGTPILPPEALRGDSLDRLKEFNDEFNRIHENIFRALGLPYEEVEVIPLWWKKKVVKLTFSNQERDSLIPIVAFDGELIIRGNNETLKALYYRGIGERTGEGFGMVKNAGEG